MSKSQDKILKSMIRFFVVLSVFAVGSFSYAMEFIIEGSGSAEVTYDGETNSYPLQIGFGLDTDFSNPTNAIAVFSKTKWEDATNPRRIFIRIDSKKAGKISLDQDNQRFIFIQDGGQLYFPREPCSMEITTPNSGDSDSHLRGVIRSCVVHSGGIDHTVSVDFEVIGTPKWKTKSSFDF